MPSERRYLLHSPPDITSLKTPVFSNTAVRTRDMSLIQLAHDRTELPDNVNTVINFLESLKTEKFVIIYHLFKEDSLPLS